MKQSTYALSPFKSLNMEQDYIKLEKKVKDLEQKLKEEKELGLTLRKNYFHDLTNYKGTEVILDSSFLSVEEIEK